MHLIPWNEDRWGVSTFQRQMNRLFEDFFGGENLLPGMPATGIAVDVSENPEAVLVRAELPGIDPKDIELSVQGDHLLIKAERKEETEKKGKTWHRVERRYGVFTRAVPLPCSVRTEKIEAVTEKGVLTVTLPKAEEAKARRIDVKVK